MTNLVERLTEAAASFGGEDDFHGTLALLREAATEIERLTGEIAEYRGHPFYESIRRVEQERDALRALLVRIERSCAAKPHTIRVASGEPQTVYDMDGGTMRELRAALSASEKEPVRG